MYECQDCGHRFELFKPATERHGLDTPPFEEFGKCPICSSTFIRKINRLHCRCCGALLPAGKIEYCDDRCRKAANQLRKREALRNRRLKMNPINIIVKQLENYNKANRTKYTYGQFVSLVLPRIKGEN